MIAFLASALSGFLAKNADEAKAHWAAASAVLSGLLMAYAVSLDARIAVVFVPAVLANIIAGKIDTKAHALGVAAFTLAAFYFPVPAFAPGFALLALLAALADESVAHDWFYPRPFLPLSALIVSVALSSPVPILAVLAFDAGYLICEGGRGGAGVFTAAAAGRKANPTIRRHAAGRKRLNRRTPQTTSGSSVRTGR